MKKLISIAFSMFLISGCGFLNSGTVVIDGGDSSRTNKVKKIALICNCTKVNPKAYDGWDGDCPGTDKDAQTFAQMCRQYNIDYYRLENERCTLKNLLSYWQECLNKLDPNDGLMIFYYSGHGGQVWSSSEKDRLDETLCFWDGQVIDDDIWILLNRVPKTARIFMVTDCCNSGTNYQVPYLKGRSYNLGLSKKKTKYFARSQEPNMIHYGGCGDGESSYGSNYGGVFTLYLKKYFNKNTSYKAWFDKAYSDIKKDGDQIPTFAETGKSFKDKKIFE